MAACGDHDSTSAAAAATVRRPLAVDNSAIPADKSCLAAAAAHAGCSESARPAASSAASELSRAGLVRVVRVGIRVPRVSAVVVAAGPARPGGIGPEDRGGHPEAVLPAAAAAGIRVVPAAAVAVGADSAAEAVAAAARAAAASSASAPESPPKRGPRVRHSSAAARQRRFEVRRGPIPSLGQSAGDWPGPARQCPTRHQPQAARLPIATVPAPGPWIRLDCSCRLGFARASLALEPGRGSDIGVMIFRLSAGLKLCPSCAAVTRREALCGCRDKRGFRRPPSGKQSTRAPAPQLALFATDHDNGIFFQEQQCALFLQQCALTMCPVGPRLLLCNLLLPHGATRFN